MDSGISFLAEEDEMIWFAFTVPSDGTYQFYSTNASVQDKLK